MKIKVTHFAAKKIKNGDPLIQEDDLLKKIETTQWVDLISPTNEWLAKGYLGKQNKGIGWVITQEVGELDQLFFEKLFIQAKQKRQMYYQETSTTAFRLFNGEGDGLGGLTIDLYERYVVFSWYNETLITKKDLILQAFQAVFPEVIGAYEKNRFPGNQPESQWIFGEKAPEPLLIKENNVTYATYLNEGLMTGIFLDQKEVRGALVDGLASGKRVLNMFSYTGAFSVAAAMGGALETTSVDLAKRSLDKTREQFLVNGIDPETQKIYVMDTFDYFKYAKKKGQTFDLIVLDPPSFARNKKKTFSVAKNYGELIEDSLDLIEEKGMIIASTNAANLSIQQFSQIIEKAMLKKKVKFVKTATYQLPADFSTLPSFSEGNYLKVFCYEILK
ncbi:class I SAM-dependent rRNA methyltransferase [Enterococcus lemanii]|uniref:Class I SAM-dependent rRNA methyltransferase n=1 Tax=Enterococcus lemanii TaxID=1159752 RepID=A0ABV9MQQ0_9ENTE|nr:class I SAM-dependent rRNA methyltransferase [Enterococcus lemanii]MBM7709944.1 23S rRNA (cytosine1962-C5)-methyltransferase [Enterococcus lemanii]